MDGRKNVQRPCACVYLYVYMYMCIFKYKYKYIYIYIYMLPLPMIQDLGLGFVMFGLIGERRQKQLLWESVHASFGW